MTISAAKIRSLPGDRECIEALAYLAENATKYKPGGFTPPLKPRKPDTELARFIAVTMRIRRIGRKLGGGRIGRFDWHNGEANGTCTGSDEALADAFAAELCSAATHSRLLVTSGKQRGVLDLWLDRIGKAMLAKGYSLQPCLSGGAVSFVVIRKGRYKWTLIYFETATGASVSDGLALASVAGSSLGSSEASAHALYRATDAVSRWLLTVFGCALRPTAGMTAMNAARNTLPADFQKWRPTPLLVAMERVGMGYRGGLTYARRYSGRTWRIDVNRQYTNALRCALPLRVSFGRLASYDDERPGVFMCRVWFGESIPYPVGIWQGQAVGFRLGYGGRDPVVCVLHSSEFPGLRASGAVIIPSYGFVYTATFDLAGYVDKIQAVIRANGPRSAQARLTKPLGNYVYGKFGQRPRRTELLFSDANPGKEWFPYWDEEGKAWENIWERTVERVTMAQHVDVAGCITGFARGQTVSMWASLSASGVPVVRCHTDSLTLEADPGRYLELNDTVIGGWKLEQEDQESIIVGPNYYFDGDGAHIAGVSEPTFEMVDRLLDGQVVAVAQTMKTPRRGFTRGEAVGTRTLTARVV